jgi:predicted enzyme related to lactoylglutathione lyase
MKNKVVHFEIPSADMKKSKAFYETIFDWKLEIWKDEYGMAQTTKSDKEGNPSEIGGINGGFYKRKDKNDVPSIVVQTDSIDEAIKKIKKAGGKITTPKHEIGEWGFMADFTDPEGNGIGLWEQPKK